MAAPRLLLDTHAAIWWWTNDPKLGARARVAIEDPASEVFLSAASVWEIALKASLGKLGGFGKHAARVPALMQQSRFRELPISAAHAIETLQVRMPHRDPFDRVLVAQANWEGLLLVTNDAVLADATETLW